MSVATPDVAARVLGQWGGLTAAIASAYKLDRWLVLSCVAQESAGDPYSWRPEPGFLDRYGHDIAASLTRVPEKAAQDRYLSWWKRDPLVFATSMGLMQTLVIVAIEQGVTLRYPTALCDPAIGVDAGCRKLRGCFDRAKSSLTPIKTALLAYNGGGAPQYADEVLAWADALQVAAKGATA